MPEIVNVYVRQRERPQLFAVYPEVSEGLQEVYHFQASGGPTGISTQSEVSVRVETWVDQVSSVSVIIPIGPGHADLAVQAVMSVMAAAEDAVNNDQLWQEFYIVTGNDEAAKIGRSAMRNRLVEGPFKEYMHISGGRIGEEASAEQAMEGAFKSEWLFFLDADDLMCSKRIYGESAFISVLPYLEIHDAIWGSIYEVHDTETQQLQVSRRKQIERFSTYEAFVKHHPFQTCQMGHFVRREAFEGFDEALDVCEDVDYYLRMWKKHRCIKQEKPLFLNRRGHHTWMKTGENNGRDWSIKAAAMMKEARDGLNSETA